MPTKRRYALRSSGLGLERPSKQPCLSFPPPSPASLKIPPRNLKSTRSRVPQSPLVKHEQSNTERIEDSIICAPFESSPRALVTPDDAERQPSPPATPSKIDSPASINPQELPAKEPVVVSVIVETVANSRVETSTTGLSREAAVESDSTPSATTKSPSGLSDHEPITGPELFNFTKLELTSNSASISSSKPVAGPEPIKNPQPVKGFEYTASEIQFHRHRVERSFLNYMSADLLQLKTKSTALNFPKALFDLEILQSTLPPMQQPPWRQDHLQALQPISDQMSSPALSMNQAQSFLARLIRQQSKGDLLHSNLLLL